MKMNADPTPWGETLNADPGMLLEQGRIHHQHFMIVLVHFNFHGLIKRL